MTHHLLNGQTRTDLAAELDCLSARLEKAEHALQRMSDELQRANDDLEQFAYAASTDLQEPLRIIGSFAKLLELHYGPQLDDKAKQFIGITVDGAQRMSEMLRDLLAYARIARQERVADESDAGKALAAALDKLAISVCESRAKITHDRLPALTIDETLLAQLFQNLIGNALKFRKPGHPCVVHIGTELRDGEPVLFVRDNGIGIPAEQRERIFAIFHRLHGRTKYPGNGIGLAICKRIVEHHGGRIWVESQPDQGATFFFTIPA
jgi:two-component system, chemotaxis family, sensor kinase Cph1